MQQALGGAVSAQDVSVDILRTEGFREKGERVRSRHCRALSSLARGASSPGESGGEGMRERERATRIEGGTSVRVSWMILRTKKKDPLSLKPKPETRKAAGAGRRGFRTGRV